MVEIYYQSRVCAPEKMVLLHVKRGEGSQFLYETNVKINVNKLAQEVVAIYNGRLKIQRTCAGEKYLWGSSPSSLSLNNKFYHVSRRNGRVGKLRLYATNRDDGIN